MVAKHQPPVTTATPSATIIKPCVIEKPAPESPLTVEVVTPTTCSQATKPVVEPPAPSPDKPKSNVLSPVVTYTDPLEKSLAKLEHDIKDNDPIEAITASSIMQLPNPLSNPIVSQPAANVYMASNLAHPILQPQIQSAIDLKPPVIASNVAQMQTNTLMHSLVEPQSNQPNMQHVQNNGFGIKHEFEIGNNNNGFPQAGISVEMSISSMFDQLPPAIQLAKNEPQIKLEDPMAMLTDKKALDPKMLAQPFASLKPNKQEPNVKNASSWSSLAKGKSPQNNTPGGSSKQQVMDSFKAFQNKAKEKADREKQRLENLEMKRLQREQAERERLRAENERRREREEEDALEKAR